MFNLAEQEEAINIIIQCAPRASPFVPPETTFYRSRYDKVQLLFVIKAYPEPSINNFTWSKKNNIKDVWETLFNESHYEIHISYDRLQTALTIQTIDVNDFGTYRVNVVNTLGSINEVFVVQAQAIPEIPQNVHVSRTGITELELQWIPGFNGGAEQTFQIIYKKINIESWTETHAPANNTRHTLSGLSAGTAYRCKMRAENIYGISSWTEDITVYTLMENELLRANTYKTLTGVEMRELTGPPYDILQDSQALAKKEIASFSFEPKLIGEEGDYVNINLSGL
ncbi:nephrin-like [Dreissena polymorpha]|uniref:nephrin-like n=1 Tax=Dreissena polymorpha TaxID=45954 RepID=UPI002264FF14|nr:nephrin-like [Dreissena polymorpha]